MPTDRFDKLILGTNLNGTDNADGSITIDATGGGGVDSIAKSGDTQLTGDVTLSAGSGVTLTQTGQDIAIAASGGGGGGDMVLIEDIELGSAQASFDFQSIPGTFKHLEIRLKARTDRASNQNDSLSMRFNNDSGNNYHRHGVRAIGTTASGLEAVNGDFGLVAIVTGATATTGYVGHATVWINDYADTTLFHGYVSSFNYWQAATTGNNMTGTFGGLWISTAAITRVTLFSPNGANLIAGSRASLYGLA